MAISIEDRFDLWHRKVIPPMAILGHAAFSGGRYFQFYLDKAFVSPHCPIRPTVRAISIFIGNSNPQGAAGGA